LLIDPDGRVVVRAAERIDDLYRALELRFGQ
jgi:hypothetical protein